MFAAPVLALKPGLMLVLLLMKGFVLGLALMYLRIAR